MILTTHQKITFGLVLIGIVILLTMPDVVIGLLTELVHLFFEVLFISFEWLESLLDHVVEHLLHTELHETQTIVFYILMGIVALPLYYLWRVLPGVFFRTKENLQVIWTQYKNQTSLYWQELSLIDKIKVVIITVGAFYLASFLVM
ncbi:MAG: hypothetical protein WCP01_05335 [Methylococcaceae bacterium]|jgi:hypothetical protein